MRPSEQKIEFLDHIRGIAILMVFLYHSMADGFGYRELPWGHWLRNLHVPMSFLAVFPLSMGWTGVAMFFAVSGFCIHLSFVRSRSQSFKEFYLRRFFRIYPPYLLALFVFILIVPKAYQEFPGPQFLWQSISHLTLLHNWSAGTYFGVNPSFWSLAIEVQLYLIYPALVFLVRRMGWAWTLTLLATVETAIRAATGIHFFVYGSEPGQWLVGSPIGFWFSWSIGAAVADAFHKNEPQPLAKWPLSLWFALAMVTWFVKPLYPFTFLFVAVLTAGAIAKLIIGEQVGVPLPRFFMEHLHETGVLSYSLYLWHQPLIGPVAVWLREHLPVLLNRDIIRFLLCTLLWASIFPLGRLLYRYCELPSMEAGKAFIKKKAANARPEMAINS